MEPPGDDDDSQSPFPPERKPSFRFALITLGVLALLSIVTLDGVVRLVTLIFLGGLALKTLIARKAGW